MQQDAVTGTVPRHYVERLPRLEHVVQPDEAHGAIRIWQFAAPRLRHGPSTFDRRDAGCEGRSRQPVPRPEWLLLNRPAHPGSPAMSGRQASRSRLKGP